MADIEIKNLSFTYSGQTAQTLNDITLHINSGEFIVVAGQTASGKSTLLKMLKKQLIPSGEIAGSVKISGIEVREMDDKSSVSQVGYVMQNPHNQIVTDKVWHELAFGLENIGVPSDTIHKKIAEVSQYFGINGWFNKSTYELSSGQKQMLNLAAVMVMQTNVLLLDEPTSQLDPIAAKEFLQRLHEINKDFGITVVLIEHDLEYVFSIADKILFMDCGQVEVFDTPQSVGKYFQNNSDNSMGIALPTPARVFAATRKGENCPLDIKSGREYLSDNFNCSNRILQNASGKQEHQKKCAISSNNIFYRYSKEQNDVLHGVNFSLYFGEILCILGGNGSGKSTLLNVLSNISKPYSGKIIVNGKNINSYKGNSLYDSMLCSLPQNPQIVFSHDNVKDELLSGFNYENRDDALNLISNTLEKLQLVDVMHYHPYDLSGGQQQKLAIAKVMLKSSSIVLLDEITKGLDAYSKESLKKILLDMKRQGAAILLVTHDIEFAADVADRCAMLFDGNIYTYNSPNDFFDENNFYTTAINKMSRHMFKGIVTIHDLLQELSIQAGEEYD